jgi:threonine/homoserine/homoserine lactone efflux protein
MISYVIPGIAYGFAAAVTPGPLSMYLISQAVAVGWRRALPAAFAPLVSDGPVMALVLALLYRAPRSMVHYLRIPGGAFILYLAYEACKSWRAFDAGGENPISPPARANSLWKAALVNWFNPNLYLGWSIILGPMVLSGWHESPAKGIAFVLGFYLTIIGTMIGIILLFASARSFGPKVRKMLIGLASMALFCLGLYQLWLGFRVL